MCVCVCHIHGNPEIGGKCDLSRSWWDLTTFLSLGESTVCKEYSSAPAGALSYTMVDPNKKRDQLKDEAGNELENSSILKNG